MIAGRDFFARPAAEVARDLLGARILTPDAGAILVEVEAYGGSDDPASHAYRGMTPRNRVMFGAAGHLYVYRSYGIHWCANVVTDSEGTAGAVLLRAARVAEGEAAVRERRGAVESVRLLRGPGNLCQGLGITGADNGVDLADPRARIHIEPAAAPLPARVGPRIGISRARESALRFAVDGDPAVSGVGMKRAPRGGP